MNNFTHGAEPGADTPKKESAGSFDTTTTDTNDATEIIALSVRIKQAVVRLASWLAVMFRGVS